ncbi:MAG: phosphoribosylformylglycinamidine synthase subunit PurS [Gemmatimonadetes bacterium]|nr:phosphoribosylformylglycinamidine synthase subunit PurS [Gemmatimonadota bacterium]MYC93224.1 phosphoribosylformylglycinamidine synthase subunit PurS [Gemmatimonadota bacterium]MYJ16944.1 phosphoribosylformylglycinamidine synthase subunit PurS [Gemmatimonadota bacterium]
MEGEALLSRFTVEVLVTPRPGLLDPQGKAIHHALSSLGYDAVDDVRVGKAIYLEVSAATSEAAAERVEEMCRKLLANPVTEDFRVTAAASGAGS